MGERPKGNTWGIERACACCVSGFQTDEEVLCGMPATVHLIWSDADPVDANFACERHRAVALSYEPEWVHEVGSCCGMPGAMFFADENVCRYPEDELPVAEHVEREVSV